MKFVNENYFKSLFEKFQKLLPFRDAYVKYLEKKTV